MQIKLAITDDHLLVISGLKAMLAPYQHISVVYESNMAASLMAALQVTQPDVLLLDIQMPDIDGMELCKQVRKKHPSIKIIALSSFMESHYIKQMLRNGASGYLLKNTDPDKLITAIEKVNAGEQFLDDLIQQQLLQEMITGQKRSGYDIPLFKAMKDPSGPNIGKAVKGGIIALIAMNVAWIAAFATLPFALIVLLFLPVSLILGKLFAVT